MPDFSHDPKSNAKKQDHQVDDRNQHLPTHASQKKIFLKRLNVVNAVFSGIAALASFYIACIASSGPMMWLLIGLALCQLMLKVNNLIYFFNKTSQTKNTKKTQSSQSFIDKNGWQRLIEQQSFLVEQRKVWKEVQFVSCLNGHLILSVNNHVKINELPNTNKITALILKNNLAESVSFKHPEDLVNSFEKQPLRCPDSPEPCASTQSNLSKEPKPEATQAADQKNSSVIGKMALYIFQLCATLGDLMCRFLSIQILLTKLRVPLLAATVMSIVAISIANLSDFIRNYKAIESNTTTVLKKKKSPKNESLGNWLNRKINSWQQRIEQLSVGKTIAFAFLLIALIEMLMLTTAYFIIHPKIFNVLHLLTNPYVLSLGVGILLTGLLFVVCKILNSQYKSSLLICSLDGMCSSFLIIESIQLHYLHSPIFITIMIFAITMAISQMIGNTLYLMVYFDPGTEKKSVVAEEQTHTNEDKKTLTAGLKKLSYFLMSLFIPAAMIMSASGIFITKFVATELLATQHLFNPTVITIFSITVGCLFGLKTFVNFLNNFFQYQAIIERNHRTLITRDTQTPSSLFHPSEAPITVTANTAAAHIQAGEQTTQQPVMCR